MTDFEIESGDFFYYSKLADFIGIDGNNFLPYIDDEKFVSFYDTRYCGDLRRVSAFDYFCDVSVEYNPYIGPMSKNESFYYFDNLKTEEKEFYSVPKKFDLNARSILVKKLNNYYFSIDYFFNFKLPSLLFHKESGNVCYFQFPDGGYYIPYDTPNAVENFNC